MSFQQYSDEDLAEAREMIDRASLRWTLDFSTLGPDGAWGFTLCVQDESGRRCSPACPVATQVGFQSQEETLQAVLEMLATEEYQLQEDVIVATLQGYLS